MTVQVFKSQYGRRGIRVSDRCPTLTIRYRLARMSVGTPRNVVRRMVESAVSLVRDRDIREHGYTYWTEEAVREAVRFALWQHAENGAEYLHVVGGRVGSIPPQGGAR